MPSGIGLRSLRISGFVTSVGLLRVLLVMVDAVIGANHVICQGQSEQTLRFRHDQVLSGATSTGPTSTGTEQQKNAVPPMLLDEILTAVKSQCTDNKRT